MAKEVKTVCRLCQFSDKYNPSRRKMPPGRLWCNLYRREVPSNKTCPKAEPMGAAGAAGPRKPAKQWKDPRYDT